MKLKNNIKVLSTVLVLLTTAVAIAKIPALITPKAPAPVFKDKEPVKLSKEEQAIIKEMYIVMHQLDSLTVMTIEGTINARDLGDSTKDLQTSFIFSRSGNKYYYRWGSSEMISLEDIFINISHDSKEIFIGQPKQVTGKMEQPLANVVKYLNGEQYKITRETANGKVKIAFNNPTNATCRDYQLTYDSTGWITSYYVRLANERNPADRSSDKMITYTLSRFEPGKAREALLKADHYLQLKDGVTIPASSLKNYELIKDR